MKNKFFLITFLVVLLIGFIVLFSYVISKNENKSRSEIKQESPSSEYKTSEEEHVNFPSLINDAKPAENINISPYYAPILDYYECEKNQPKIIDYDEKDGANIFGYSDHWGIYSNTPVSFKDIYKIKYVGIKISLGEDLIDDFYIEFNGGFSFKSSKNKNFWESFAQILPSVNACSGIDFPGGGGTYVISSKLNFATKEKDVLWFTPEEELTVGPEINGMQISFYKKNNAGGPIMLTVDNIIFEKNNSYFFLDHSLELLPMQETRGYPGCINSSFNGILTKNETGSISFTVEPYYKNNNIEKFIIQLTNIGKDNINLNNENLENIPISAIEVFSGDNLNNLKSVLRVDLGESSEFASRIKGKTLFSGGFINVDYKINKSNKVVVELTKKSVSNQNEFSVWVVGDPFIYDNNKSRVTIK